MRLNIFEFDEQERDLKDAGVPVPDGFNGGRKSYSLAPADYCRDSELEGVKLASIGVL